MKENRFYPYGYISGWSMVRVIGATIRRHYYILRHPRTDSTALYVDVEEFHSVLKDYLVLPEVVEGE